MRGSRVAGVGLGLVLGAGAWAGEPAARFATPADVVARGQASNPPAGGILSPVRPVPQGPTVTETRTPNTVTPPPAATFGPITPLPGDGPLTIGGPTTYLGLPPVAGAPPGVAPVVATPNMDPPMFGGTGPATRPLGILTGGNGFNGPSRLRLDGEFLLWWVRSGSTPPLVVTGALDRNNLLVPGTSQTLFGGDSLGRTLHTGARFGATYWLDDTNRWGIDGSLFFLTRRATSETFASDGTSVLARPFFNANQGIPFLELVAAPGLASGSVGIGGDTQLWGADINVRRHLCGGCDWRLDALLGFRYVRFAESLEITENVFRSPNAPDIFGDPTVSSAIVSDRFRTENNFYGVNVGLAGEVRRGKWFAEGKVAVGLGTWFQTVQVAGSQQTTGTNGVANYEGGLLALPGNIGTYSQRKFGVVPEAGFKLGYHLTDRWRVNVGYNFLYLNSVLRPGDQIDQALDITRIPNFQQPAPVAPLASPRPMPVLRDSGVFVQGISFGLQWSF